MHTGIELKQIRKKGYEVHVGLAAGVALQVFCHLLTISALTYIHNQSLTGHMHINMEARMGVWHTWLSACLTKHEGLSSIPRTHI